MEKMKLNNQIVIMRKYVKQAKVHTINKLVKHVKLLQNRKGNEFHVLKAKRKAERFLEEISLLKKTKPDYISKLALSKAKDWKEVLLQKNSTLEDRCTAMLSSYGPVQKQVEIFHNSNKDLASKITDLIQQWDEKNKFHNDLSQKKESNFKKLKNGINMQPMKSVESLLNDSTDKSETADNGNKKFFDEGTGSNMLLDNTHELKRGKRKNKSAEKQKLSSVELSKNSSPAEKISEEVLHNNENLEENLMEIEISDNIENRSKILLGDNDENESETDCESSGESESKNNSDIRENDESAHEDIPKNEYKTKNTKIEDIDVKNLQLSEVLEFKKENSHVQKSFAVSGTENFSTSCSFVMKNDTLSKSGENKVKAIAMLNLDEFKDLDEIPVNNSIESDESGKEYGTDEDATNDELQNDPFFLRHDEAISTENRLVDSTKGNKYVSEDKIFYRKEKSNYQPSYTKNFQKPLNSSQLSSTDSSKYKSKRNFMAFKKDKFMSKNVKDRYQHKSNREDFKNTLQPYKQDSFARDNCQNQRRFKKKIFSEAYWNNKHNNTNDLNCRNGGDNAFGKSKKSHKKDDANIKPLHPSWEAKRKQKGIINTSFQGKRVVFEN